LGGLILEDVCYFIEGGMRCQNKREPLSHYCSKHKEYLKDFDNKILIEMAAKYFDESLYITEDKKLSLKKDMRPLGNFTNYLNELVARGYTQQEALQSIGDVLKTKKILRNFKRN
jgi:hypothetical protein